MDFCLGSDCSFAESVIILSSSAIQALGHQTDAITSGLPWFWPFCAALIGAILASLAGLIAHRLPAIKGWGRPADPRMGLAHPASHCDSCGTRLEPLALIPVIGWFLVRGRCTSCHTPVPWIYPAIEGGTALASMAIIAFMGPGWTGWAACLCLWLLLVASWIDWESQEIPDGVTVPFLFLGLLASPFDPDPLSRILGAVLAGGFVWTAFRITSSAKKVDAMSYGDVALACAIGGWCGLCGAPLALIAGVLAYLGYAVPLRARDVVWVPMGPGLSIGMMVVILLGLSL